MRWVVQRETNHFCQISIGSQRIVQVTDKATTELGAKMLCALVMHGIDKEGLEFIEKSGLLSIPELAN